MVVCSWPGTSSPGRHAREGARPARAPFPCVGPVEECPDRSHSLEHRDLTSPAPHRPGRRPHRSRRRHPRRAHWNKSVTLSVDGASSSVGVFGSTVGDVLAKQRHHPRPARRRRPLGVRADRRRRQGRRALRPAADGHRGRREEELLDHRHDGVLGAVRDGHPRRHGQAVGVALADPRPAGPRARRHHPQAGLGQGGRHDAARPQHRPDRQGRAGRDEGQRRRQGPGPPGPDLRRRQARRGDHHRPGEAEDGQGHPGRRVRQPDDARTATSTGARPARSPPATRASASSATSRPGSTASARAARPPAAPSP